MEENKNKKAYLVGGGIVSLAAAAYLIRDGGFAGENITIFEASDKIGGSLDARFAHGKNGYIMRGYRMFEEKVYSATLDLLSFIPSPEDPSKTLKEDFLEFNKNVKTNSHSRLIGNGKKINAKNLKIPAFDKIKILKLLASPEIAIKDTLKIEEYFSQKFFRSNFWIEFCTTFSFQKWHSLEEFRRYILRFIQDSLVLDTARCIRNTPYNQYDSIVNPLARWLKNHKVKFKTGHAAENIIFKKNGNIKLISSICCVNIKEKKEIEIKKDDLAFITLGSIVENSVFGSTESAPQFVLNQKSPAWDLWENISVKNIEFGNPHAFCCNINKTKWISFTITCRNPLFFKLVRNITKKKTGSDRPITLKSSKWLISFALPRQPYFINQPEELSVCWGYGLFPDEKGNFVNKKMSQCGGEEILTELCGHLGFSARQTKKVIETSECIPCLMPYITSQFMPHKKGDRPEVVPDGAENFAFLGQFCEIPEDIVFTIEYSVRSAQIAVYTLLGLNKKPSPIYKGQHNVKVIWNAIKTVFR